MRALIGLVLICSVFGQQVAAANVRYCQDDSRCVPCETTDGSCTSVTGKRIDAGGSLGAFRSPPPNTERQLAEETRPLLPAPEVMEPASAPVMEERADTRVARRAVFDSVTAPKFSYGHSDLTPALESELLALAELLKDKENLRLKVTGHTDSHRLSATAARIYTDNYGLGLERARKTAAFLAAQLNLPAERMEIATAGPFEPVAGNDTEDGRARNRRVEIFIDYDEPPAISPKAPVTIAPVAEPLAADPEWLQNCREILAGSVAAAAAPYRISIDGVPLEDSGTIDPDIQRCTDVMLAAADIQIRYDGFEVTPWLNLSASPNSGVYGEPIVFTAYSNYEYWIERGEVRLFSAGSTPQSPPLQILPLDAQGRATWVPGADFPGQVEYLLRVYDAGGRFDETWLKPLLIDHQKRSPAGGEGSDREELIGYGENSLRVRNIPVRGGAITVNGKNLPEDSDITVLGRSVPLAANGRFATRQILPPGHHQVDVQVRNQLGQLDFSRNLYLPDDDWFYIGIADLIAGRNHTSGPAQLVTTDTQHYDNELYIDGRLAFYLKGKIKGEWLLTAAADTREQPFKHLFSNFDAKDPRYLLRRLDPDLYYPVYGDDSTTIDDAPTSGKFYVKLQREDSHVMWGNFHTRWTGTDFAQINRGLYGANLHLVSEETTGYGERRAQLDLFAGDPGTLGGRDEFRGTGGSLFYLRRLDITRGSERVWVEIRDKDSGIVLRSLPLVAGQDYDLNPLQGRLLLTTPLSSTASDSQLIRAGSMAGHPQYLVVTYEYTPGLTATDNLTLGGRATSWIGDHLHVGVTGYRQDEDDTEQRLGEVDATLRYSSRTYIKGEVAHSEGAGSGASSSLTGGYEFAPQTASGERALAGRVEAALDFGDISDQQGNLNLYWQQREAGFSAPGQLTNEDIEQTGAALQSQLTEQLSVETRADARWSDSQDTIAASVTGHYQLNPEWKLSAGMRYDELDTAVANASPTLSQNGVRTDLAGQLEYAPEAADWSIYGFGQGTVKRTEDRRNNNRVGVGGRYRLSDPLTLTAEASAGSGGFGGRLAGDWRVNERSQLYLDYALDTDRTDTRYRGRQGQLTSGGRTRYSEALTLYAEERFLHGSGPSGLIHAFGLDLAAFDRWNFGFKAETGELSDPISEDLERTAFSFSAGYTYDRVRYAGNLEWRQDDGSTSGKRTTWLMRNSLGYQTTPSWRLLTKLNFSFSDSDQGDFYNAEFIEAMLGYAYRPVDNDRLNALFKYTYFYDLPSAGALTPTESLADYAQKSHVLSVDAMYDLVPWLTVGGKYGYRYGAIRDNRTGGDWFSSNAHLGIVRGDLHFVHNWDAVLEGRVLRVTAAKDTRAGVLAAVYRHFNRHVKLGVGYNFTDFSDDLTNLDYDSRGWFINLIGKM